MTIEEIIKSGKVVSEVPSIKRVSCVNISFLNGKKMWDETQLTVENHILTKAGMKELVALFISLIKELDTTAEAVMDITIVASAETSDGLTRMGF